MITPEGVNDDSLLRCESDQLIAHSGQDEGGTASLEYIYGRRGYMRTLHLLHKASIAINAGGTCP